MLLYLSKVRMRPVGFTVFRVDDWWFFQAVSTPSKRKQMSSPSSGVNLTPNKKLKTLQESPEDGSCRRVLRLRPHTPTSKVRMSPRKSSRTPTTPTTHERTSTPSKASPARPTKEGGAKSIQEVPSSLNIQRKAQVTPTKTIKSYFSYLSHTR